MTRSSPSSTVRETTADPAPKAPAAPEPEPAEDAPRAELSEVEQMMLADACGEAIAEPVGARGVSAARLQRWVCEDAAAQHDVSASLGVFEVRVGETADGEAPTQSAVLRCGDALEELAAGLRGRLLVKIIEHLESPDNSAIRCHDAVCEVPPLMEFDPALRIEFTDDGRYLKAIVAVDTLLVEGAVLEQWKTWADAQVAKRPKGCPDPSPAP